MHCREDPWRFLTHWCFTVDTNDQDNPAKLFPNKEHLWVVTQYWLEYNVLLVPKSRQMSMTWLFCALYFHNALFIPHRINFFQSKKEDDADELLERTMVMYNNLPKWMKAWAPINRTHCRILFPRNSSRIFGVPSGADHIRGYQSSGVFNDESVYQDEIDKMIAAVKPSIRGGGRLTMTSSAGPSYFGALVLDQV